MIKVATAFSGIGSPEQALKELGIEHRNIFACEIDKYARQTYLANFTPENMFTDMTDGKINDHYADLFIGGIPCQSFSLAGKRLGELDPRGLLFYNFHSYVKVQQPKYFIIENVKGLLSSKSDSTISNILLSLLYKFKIIEKWETLNTQKNNVISLSQTISNYLLLILHQKQELQIQESDIYLTKNLELNLGMLEQKVKLGLTKRLKYLEEKIYLITKKSNCYQQEPIVQSELKEEDLILNPNLLFSIKNLKAKVTNLLEITVDIHANIDLFAKKELGENSKKEKLYITLMELNSIMNSQTCMYVVEMNIIRLIILALDLSQNLWKEILLILTKKREYIGLKTFDIWLSYLDNLGYNINHAVLNSKDFGVPQNRERVFIVGIRNDLPNNFSFPTGFPLTIRLKDILEPVVDEKYYLSEKALEYITNQTRIDKKFTQIDGEIASALTTQANNTGDFISDKIIVKGECTPNSQGGKVYGTEGVAPTITAGTHGYALGYIQEPTFLNGTEICNTIRTGGRGSLTEKHSWDIVVEPQLNIVGNIPGHEQDGRVYSDEGICSTLDTQAYRRPNIETNLRIRRLTPTECFRLQGFPDSFIKPVSSSQLYKQAGNTITVNVIRDILKNLLLVS